MVVSAGPCWVLESDAGGGRATSGGSTPGGALAGTVNGSATAAWEALPTRFSALTSTASQTVTTAAAASSAASARMDEAITTVADYSLLVRGLPPPGAGADAPPLAPTAIRALMASGEEPVKAASRQSLKLLDVSQNRLAKVTPELGHCLALTHLDLSGNHSEVFSPKVAWGNGFLNLASFVHFGHMNYIFTTRIALVGT